MPIGSSSLSLLSFPQSWDGTSLLVRFLCLPREGPEVPLAAGVSDFAHANLVFSARIVSGLDRLPSLAESTPIGPLVLHTPLNKTALFEELAEQFEIVPRQAPAVPRPAPEFLKATTASYDKIAGTSRRSKYLRASGDYECALHEAAGIDPAAEPPVLATSLTWGRVIAYAIRQPALAERLGLMGQADIEPPDGFFAKGGWLFIDLDGTSDGAGVVNIAHYAARIPPLEDARPIFAAVLFPVDPAIPLKGDDVFREAERYDNGIAKQVHGAQITQRAADPRLPERGDAIQLGWDDEQVAIWLNRQAKRSPGDPRELDVDAPSGVAGYRVDVREPGVDTAWRSLVRMKSAGNLTLGPHSLGRYEGEGVIEAIPAQHAKATTGTFWLPPYFAAWHGGSLALSDSNALHIQQSVAELMTAAEQAPLLTREKVFLPVADQAVRLRYGHSYEFRVRLADLTRGGPSWEIEQPKAPESAVLPVDFKRRRKPGPLNRVVSDNAVQAGELVLEKPRLGYPDALFAGATLRRIEQDLENIADTLEDIPDTLDGSRRVTTPREAGVFDPDVVAIEIEVAVKAPGNDVADHLTLYTTRRAMPRSRLTLALNFKDVPQLAAFASAQPTRGALALPTARDLQLTLTPLGREDENYFYDDDARRGVPITVHVRAEAEFEGTLLTDAPTVLQSFFFQPAGEPSAAPPSERLAAALGLEQTGMTLGGKPGRRMVIGCSAELRHTLSPERSTITFASVSDLFSRWINVVRFTLERDLTWNGLAPTGIAVTRVIRRPLQADVQVEIGALTLPHAIASSALRDVPPGPPDPRAARRQSTDMVFFDAFDPKPAAGFFPSESTVEYVLRPQFTKAPAPADETRTIDLPVTTPPEQLPKIISAGFALSRYHHADDYSSTDQRQRKLWFEFDEAPRDPGDAYFVRILGYAPDPVLLGPGLEHPLPEAPEPALPIDPELMRTITPGQPTDDSGLGAMTRLEQSPRDRNHYLVPLPEGLTEQSPELFGFFVYEVRIGHADGRWSTAQGRFGPPLRIAGVQHPAPALTCQAARGRNNVYVSAPFADAVHQGRSLRPRSPQSQLWALLYARVRQVDAKTWRNVLIAQQRLQPLDAHRADTSNLTAEATIALSTIRGELEQLGLGPDAPLTVLTAEVFGTPKVDNPLKHGLGRARLLRVSPLIPVPDAC